MARTVHTPVKHDGDSKGNHNGHAMLDVLLRTRMLPKRLRKPLLKKKKAPPNSDFAMRACKHQPQQLGSTVGGGTIVQ